MRLSMLLAAVVLPTSFVWAQPVEPTRGAAQETLVHEARDLAAPEAPAGPQGAALPGLEDDEQEPTQKKLPAAGRRGRSRAGPSRPALRSTQPASPQPESYFLESLAVAGLLALWLLSRWQKAGAERKPRRAAPSRSAPIKPEELGRAVLQAVREANLEAYRLLFLNGAEAVQAFGREAAEKYLDRRTLPMLQASLDALMSKVPGEATYQGARLDTDGTCVLRLKLPSGEELEVPAGSSVRVGAVLRLSEAVVS